MKMTKQEALELSELLADMLNEQHGYNWDVVQCSIQGFLNKKCCLED